MFTGVHSYDTIDEVNETVKRTANYLAESIRADRLNTFDINSNLNIIPDFVKDTLAWVLSSNAQSEYVKKI